MRFYDASHPGDSLLDQFDRPAWSADLPDPMSLGSTTPHASAPPPTQALYVTEPGSGPAISVSDINQGQLGDCYLLSAVGEIAMHDPQFITDMIHVNGNGTETVRLYEAANGTLANWNTTAFKQVTETVTNVFSTASVNNGASQDVYNGLKEIWPQVLEKAYAALGGGYASIASGGSPLSAMAALTGHATSHLSPAGLSLAALQGLQAAGDLIVMDTPASGALPDHLVNSHAYMFDGVVGTGSAASVKLLNPWGTYQPSPVLLSSLSRGIVEVDVGHLR